ncbi:hypothetical protein [Actinomadura sp. 3N508]
MVETQLLLERQELVEASTASLARRRSELFVVTEIYLRSGVPSRVGVG